MITVTLYGRVNYVGTVWADDNIFITHIRDPDTTTMASVPDNTRLLSVWASGHKNDNPDLLAHEKPGILIKLSNGLTTDTHWRCRYSAPYDSHNKADFNELAYDDSDWPHAVVRTWPRGEHDLHPAECISGEQSANLYVIWCRVRISKYTKHYDCVK